MNNLPCLIVATLLSVPSFAASAVPTSLPPRDAHDEVLVEKLASDGGRAIDAMGNILPHPINATVSGSTSVPTNMVLIPAAADGAIVAFLAGRYEVTNFEYLEFLRATGGRRFPRHWTDGRFPANESNYPVTNITREDALAYCAWVSLHTDRHLSLPTAAQARHLRQGAILVPSAAPRISAVGGNRRDLNTWGCYDILGNAGEFSLDEGDGRADRTTGFRLIVQAIQSDHGEPIASLASMTTATIVAEEPTRTLVVVASNNYIPPLVPPPRFEGPMFIVHPQSQAVSVGSSVTLTASATSTTGSSSIRYQWYFNGSSLAGATGTTYSIASFQSVNIGAYHVEAVMPELPPEISGSTRSDVSQPTPAQELRETSNPAVVTIGTTGTAPAITRQPASIVVLRGDTALVTASFTGTGPLAMRWRIWRSSESYAGLVVRDFTDFQFTASDTSATLSYRNPPTDSVTTVRLTVFGAFGSSTTESAVIRAITEGSAPTISSHPRNQSVTRGSSAVLQVAATGAPPPTFQWYRNGIPLPDSNSNTLTLSNVQDAELGAYTVTVTNSLGSVTSTPATLSLSTSSTGGAGSGGGGGGAPSGWFVGVVSTIILLRALLRRASAA